MATVYRYLGAWAQNTAYESTVDGIIDFVIDPTGDSGSPKNTYFNATATHTSTAVGNIGDDLANWEVRVGNKYYNNDTVDGGPHLTEGTLATATEVEGKFTAVAAGFDKLNVQTGGSLTLSASDHSTRDVPELASSRVNTVLGFDETGKVGLFSRSVHS